MTLKDSLLYTAYSVRLANLFYFFLVLLNSRHFGLNWSRAAFLLGAHYLEQLGCALFRISVQSAKMGDGHVFQLVEEVLRPVQTAIDTLFYAGVLYGATRCAAFFKTAVKGVRTYFIPLGSYKRCDLSKRFGKWAVITCGTSGIGMAYAHEVSLQVDKF